MAAYSEIVVSRSVRVNTGNYEGVEHFMNVKVVLGENESGNIEATVADANALVETSMLQSLRRSYRIRGVKISDTEICKRHGLGFADINELEEVL